MKNMIKDALILFAITIIAGLLLGVVYDVTKEPIAEQKQKAKMGQLKLQQDNLVQVVKVEILRRKQKVKNI